MAGHYQLRTVAAAVALGCIVLALGGVTLTGLRNDQRFRTPNEIEDPTWAIYQLNTAYHALSRTLEEAERGELELDEINIRYQVLLSQFHTTLTETQALLSNAPELTRDLQGMQAIAAGWAPAVAAARSVTGIPPLRALVRPFGAELHAYVLRAHHHTQVGLSRLKQDLDDHVRHLKVVASGLVAAALAILSFVWLQFRREARARGHAETLAMDLAKARDLAEAGSRSKSAFLATISHEIRTPLHGILGIAEVLAGGDLAPTQARHAEIIRKSADALLGLVGNLLDFTRLEVGSAQLVTAPYEPRRMVEGVLDLYWPRANAKGLWLEACVGPEVPQQLHGDEARLRQIVTNLVSNAIKFTETGGVAITVCAHPDAKATVRLEISVADTGIGIAAGDQQRLFQPFTQIDDTVGRHFQGVGLGLAISRSLAHSMGGDIRVDSGAGKGSVFTLLQPAAVAVGPPSALNFEGVVQIFMRSRTEEDLMRQKLRQIGWTAPTGPAASPGIPMVVVIDLDRPDAQRLLESHGDQKILCVGSTSAVDRMPGTALSKPVHIAALAAAFDRDHAHVDLVAREFAPVAPAPQLSILVVDDSEINIDLVREVTAPAGHAVTAARCGAEAVAFAAQGQFDVILMDVMMPGMDGYAATRAIRALSPPTCETPIIAVTANAMDNDENTCLAAGMNGYLSKPFNQRRLLSALQRAVRRAQTPSQSPLHGP